MVRPQDVSLYPEYLPINGSSIFHCSALKNNCGASIPLYAFVSYDYADHYVGTSSEINDTNYGYDNSGVPLCYLWNVPQDSESVSQISSEYPTSTNSCDVHSFLGLKSTVNTKNNATTNTANNTTVTSSSVVNNNVAGANSSTTAAVSTGNSTQSSMSTELEVGSNTTSTLSPSHDDPIGNNSSAANTNGSSNNTWIWVVLGIGVAVAVLATIVMTCLVISNSASTPGNASVSPYRLYTADTIEPPPVPASSMPLHSY
uniref:Uncharacterized protein n=1 Tax=Acrobeloides nanus TaxID=290746 RepID=A0A914EK09_9BILA